MIYSALALNAMMYRYTCIGTGCCIDVVDYPPRLELKDLGKPHFYITSAHKPKYARGIPNVILEHDSLAHYMRNLILTDRVRYRSLKGSLMVFKQYASRP